MRLRERLANMFWKSHLRTIQLLKSLFLNYCSYMNREELNKQRHQMGLLCPAISQLKSAISTRPFVCLNAAVQEGILQVAHTFSYN